MSTQPFPGVGSAFGPYRIDAVLGRGGMGVVYRAQDLRLQRSVALKLLSSQLRDDDRFRERFLRESRLAAATEHPGIVPVYEAAAVAVGGGAVWVASEVDRSLKRIDIVRGGVSREIQLGANPTAVAVGAGAVWVASEEAGVVFRIEPRAGVVTETVAVGGGPVALAVGEGAVWVVNRQDATVSRIDPATYAVTDRIKVGRDPTAIAAGEGGVWVASAGDATIARIDPATHRTTKTIALSSSPSAIAVGEGSLWTATLVPAASHRGGTLRVEQRPFDYKRLEPANYDADSDRIMSLVYSGLVSYRRAGGATYGSLVGDLATEVPKPSPDGLTYVFKLRRNIRFSNGALVKPEDFRASLERFLARHGNELPPFYHRIVGARQCAQRPERCDLAKGVVTDSAAGTITLHLTEPDTELMHALAFMFAYVAPAEHPFGGKEQPPGTGPYQLASFEPKKEVRLVRNPRFREYSRDARPDGAVDEIVVRIRPDDKTAAQARAVDRGEADLLTVTNAFGSGMSAASVRALASRSAGRLYTDASPVLEYMFMNVKRPPFDDVDVRRALSYAVDRDRIAEIAGGTNLAERTCQIVPIGFPAYTPSCRYTVEPGPGGAWSGPDLARARRLIRRSGTVGMKVTVWTYEHKRAYGAYFRELLAQLGYRSALRVAPDYGIHREAVAAAGSRAQIGIEGWGADLAVPSNFAVPFACEAGVGLSGANLTRFCDRAIDAQADAARRVAGTDSTTLWQKVYSRIEAAAPAVPLVNRREVSLVSRRVSNYQHHPMWGVLLDQLWVR